MRLSAQLKTGFEVVVMAAEDVGAEMMYGYPITPTTDIFTTWINNGHDYLQTEDEIGAGFGVCGSVMAGSVAFTATAGPGHVLMQDAFSMAEGMRLPFVGVIGQRGGPSSGTVIYSQQEVNLACYGGNGEGHRIVYSPATLEELYFLTGRAFVESWKYRFPAIILTDGYLLKTRGGFSKPLVLKKVEKYSLINPGQVTHWRNIYTTEEELNEVLEKNNFDYNQIIPEVATAEELEITDAEIIIIAHGIVGSSAKVAVQILRHSGIKVGLFRPVTLRPFPEKQLNLAVQKAKKVVVAESSLGQLYGLVKREVNAEANVKFEVLQKPALGIEPEDIVNFVKKI